MQVLETVRPLISGYHRDFQDTKRPLMTGMDVTLSALRVNALTVARVEVDEERCVASFTPEVFATDRVMDLSLIHI